jgi:hypothetical protein
VYDNVFEHPFDAVGEDFVLSGDLPKLVPYCQIVDAISFQPQTICLLAIIFDTNKPGLSHLNSFPFMPIKSVPTSQSGRLSIEAMTMFVRDGVEHVPQAAKQKDPDADHKAR